MEDETGENAFSVSFVPLARYASTTRRKTMAPTLNPPPNDTPSIAAIQRTLRRQYRLQTLDRRVFTGELVCIDKQGNIILDYATELPPPPEKSGEAELRAAREVGLVLIPKRWWRSIEVSTT